MSDDKRKKAEAAIMQYINGLFGRTEGYARAVSRHFTTAVNALLDLAAKADMAPDEVFYFADDKRLSAKATAILRGLYSAVYQEIRNGVIAEWGNANAATDLMLTRLFGKGLKEDNHFARWFTRNQEAMDSFFSRKDVHGGLNLSQKVWKYTSQFKEEMELALSASLGRGDSAATVSRHVRQYLQEPERLFRRVRDAKGNLKLSKRAAAYHPGRGEYRSSYRNAMRLARTETNAAYRAADCDRWGSIPFVVGMEVKRSNHPFGCEVCELLKGKYPKDFVFTGWHPQCRCYIVPVLADEKERMAYHRAVLSGEDVSDWHFKGEITEPHKGFKKWMKENRERIENARSLPYFLRDNGKYVKGAAEIPQHTGQGASASLRQRQGFVPAASLEEAKSRLVGYGFKSVELGDASLQQANTILKAVHEESLMGKFDIDRLVLKPGTLRSVNIKNADQAASFMVDKATGKTTMTLQTGIFELNQHQKLLTWEQKIEACQSRIDSLRKDIEGLEGRLGRNKSADRMIKQMIKDDKSKISDWEIKLRDYQKAMKSGESVLPETIATTFEKIDDQVRCTLHHEFGHYHDHKLGYPKIVLSKDVSVYGSTARNEHFAECWAKYAMGSREIPNDMLKLFDEYTGKSVVPTQKELSKQTLEWGRQNVIGKKTYSNPAFGGRVARFTKNSFTENLRYGDLFEVKTEILTHLDDYLAPNLEFRFENPVHGTSRGFYKAQVPYKGAIEEFKGRTVELQFSIRPNDELYFYFIKII